MRTKVFICILTIAIIFLLACGSTSPAPQPTAATSTPAVQKEPVLYTAKQCFTSMVGLAQRWTPDAMPFHMESELTSEATGQGGKATIWRAIFASQSRGTMESFICSGSRLPSSPALGFTSTAENAYPPNVPAMLFLPSYFQTDSDKAFDASLEHGGTAMIKKDPKQPVVYLLDWDPKTRQLLWSLIYGKSQADRQGLCVVNATTGGFIRAGK